MNQAQRHEKIVAYINKEKAVSVQMLSELFNTSKVTIRKDLETLAAMGLVQKNHGGAMSVEKGLSQEIPYMEKYATNTQAKQMIGKAAAEHIRDGDVIVLDCGSTTFEIAQNIMNKNVTVITNDVMIASKLAMSPTVELIVAGGVVKKSGFAIIGSDTEKFFEQIHVDKAFVSAHAVDIEFGVTNRVISETPVKQAIVRCAQQVTLVVDHSKLHKKVFSFVYSLRDIDRIIIDEIDEADKKAIEDQGVEVMAVNLPNSDVDGGAHAVQMVGTYSNAPTVCRLEPARPGKEGGWWNSYKHRKINGAEHRKHRCVWEYSLAP